MCLHLISFHIWANQEKKIWANKTVSTTIFTSLINPCRQFILCSWLYLSIQREWIAPQDQIRFLKNPIPLCQSGIPNIQHVFWGVRREQHKHRKHANSAQKGPECPEGIQSQDQQCKLRNCWSKGETSLAVSENKMFKSRWEAQAEAKKKQKTPYLFHFSALSVELLPSQRAKEERRREERRASSLTPQRQQHWSFLPEAGSSAHREVAPEETAYMTASLCSLLPQFIHV